MRGRKGRDHVCTYLKKRKIFLENREVSAEQRR